MPEFREYGEKSSGKKLSKNVWIIGGGVAVLIVAYSYSKAKKQAANTAANAASSTDPNAIDPNAIDPNTGIPYGQEGFGGFLNGATGVTPGSYGYIGQNGTVLGGLGTVAGQLPGTNAQWFQAAETYMVGQGYDPLATGAALGKYLAGQPLTSDQMTLVQTAIGAEGNPPTSVPPPHVAPPAGQTPPVAARPVVADGFYRLIETGAVYQVVNGTRHHVTPATWKVIGKTTHLTSILSSSPVMALPEGSLV